MKIESIKLKNFRAFKDCEINNIPSLCIIVGANGAGKSTLFDLFGFLRDCFTNDLNRALNKRGGLHELRTRGEQGPIEVWLNYRVKPRTPLLSYYLSIDEKNGKPIVAQERLTLLQEVQNKKQILLNMNEGVGNISSNEHDDKMLEEEPLNSYISLARPDILAIKVLTQLKKFDSLMPLSNFIENWHVSDFHINSARQIQDDGYAEHLSREGENLSLVTQYLYERHRDIFNTILDRLKERVPGIENVTAKVTEEGRVLLKFHDGNFQDPFLARYVSDGTIKMFAYLVLLYDPSPYPLLCVEEPENQLYPKLLTELAEEFRLYAKRGGQVFISTHSPDLLNAATLDEVFWLIKENGYTRVKRAGEDEQIVAFMAEGDQMGYLWKQGFFEGVDPNG